MRRILTGLAMAALVALPVVAPVTAAQPDGRGPKATHGPLPTATPDATPAPTEASAPTPTATVAPTTSPTPATTADPLGTPNPTAAASAVDRPALAPAASPSGTPTADDPLDTTDRYIVVLKNGTDPDTVVARHGKSDHMEASKTFKRAFKGFSAKLDAAQRRALRADPNVAEIVPDERIELASQTTPTGVSRVGARYSTMAGIDGVDQRVDADVAIVDTGIYKHSDLNVVGGYNCSTSDPTLWRDKEGHGTHVAGTVAAKDNSWGVVGVAPGARLWAVKILNDNGDGLLSWYVCGLDWILSQRDPIDPSRPLIEAVNMSVAKWGSDDGACGSLNQDILHAAICRVVAGGITVVAAAANDHGSATKRVPASYNEVITVSALADTDGKAGGLGGHRCYSWGTYDRDDTFADFSNYGYDVDIIAPGKCIWSTVPGGYAYSSGTSMAAPAVTGAVALYKATRPMATPAQVKEALQYLGNYGWSLKTDPDSRHEKLLDVSRIGPLGTFAYAGSTPAATGEAGGTAQLPLAISRSSTSFERVRFTALDLPSGWAASSPSAIGWTADSATMSLSIPRGVRSGTYQFHVRADGLGHSEQRTVSLTVTNDIPTAFAPSAAPLAGQRIGVNGSGTPSALALHVAWKAATDPSSLIAGYEIERREGSGPWMDHRSVAASVLSIDVSGLAFGVAHQFRVRAVDQVGNWSAWKQGSVQTFRAISDRTRAISYSGTWRAKSVSTSTNRVHSSATAAGARATYSFSGRTVSIVMPRSPVRGKFTVYLDGVKIRTIDTYASAGRVRRVMYVKAWPSIGTHRITIRVAGTSGRPLISLDGIIVGK